MNGPDISILIGAKGGYSVNGDSARLIRNQLNTALAAGIKVKVGLDKASVKELKDKIASLTAPNAGTQKAANTLSLPIVNTAQLKASGKSYITASKDLVADVQKTFSALGSVDVTNIFRTPQGEITAFTAAVKKSDGTLESYRYQLAQLKDAAKTFTGFVPVGSIGTDKTAGTGYQQTLNYLSAIQTRIENITSRTLTATQKPLLPEMGEYSSYETKLRQVSERIQQLRTDNQVLSDEHKREINSMVADLQRYAKELQTSAYAGTELKAVAFTEKKAQLQKDLSNQIRQWDQSGLTTPDFNTAAAQLTEALNGAADSAGLDMYLNKLRLLKAEFQGLSLDANVWAEISKNVTLSSDIEAAQLKVKNLKTQYNAFVSDPKLRKEWQALFDESQIVNSKSALQDLNAKISVFEQKLTAAGKRGLSYFSQLSDNFSKMASWMVMGTLVAKITGGLNGMYTAVTAVDGAMTELRKVTDETEQAYSAFLDRAGQQATEMGASLADFVNATADYSRLGYSMEQSEELAKIALMYKNVGDEVASVDSATQSIISTMKAFNIAADNSVSIIDKFNEVGNKYAISSGGIGEALQRSAASLSAANNTLDESIALIVAANNVVQNPEKVGTMYQTVAARIRSAKAELEEAGLDTENMAESASKLRDTVMALTNVDGAGGIDILSDSKTFKSTYTILLEISKVWGKMSDVDQAALLELLAGKRQSNALASAITNMDDAVKVLNTSMNSAGSASREYERWLESVEAKQQQFSAAYQVLSTTILDSDLVKGTIDAGTGLLGWLNRVIERVGVLPTVLGTIGGIRSLGGDKGFFQLDTEQNWGGSGIGITTALAASKAAQADFATQLQEDVRCLQDLESAVQNNNFTAGTFSSIMKTASVSAKTYAAQTKGAAGSATAFAVSQEAAAAASTHVSIASKAASIGVTALNAALNMVAVMAVVTAITAVVKAIDNLHVSLEEQHEKVEGLRQEYSDLNSQMDEYNSKLETTKERINELLAKDSLSFVEQEELDRLQKENDYLETQIKLQRELNIQKGQEANRELESEFQKSFAPKTYKSLYETDSQKVYVGRTPDQYVYAGDMGAHVQGNSAADISKETYYQELQRKMRELYDSGDTTSSDFQRYKSELLELSGECSDFANRVIVVDQASQKLRDTYLDLMTAGVNAANGIFWSQKLTDGITDGVRTASSELLTLKAALDEFADGNVNLSVMPEIASDAEVQIDKWFRTVLGDDLTYAIHLNTILDDGTQLSEDDLKQYLDDLVNGAVSRSDVLERDKLENGGKGIVLAVHAKMDTLSDAKFAELENIWGQSLGEAQTKYYDFIRALGDNHEFAEFVALAKELGVVSDSSAASLLYLAQSMEQVKTASENSVTSAASFTEIAGSIGTAYKAIVTAQKEMADNGYLTVDSIKALEASGLTGYLSKAEDGYKLTGNALNDYLNKQKQQYQVSLNEALAAANNLISQEEKVAIAYDNTSASIYDQIKALKAVAEVRWKAWNAANDAFIKSRMAEGDTYSEASRMSQYNADVEAAYSEYKALSDAINNVATAQENLRTFDRVTASYARDNAASASKTASKAATVSMDELYKTLKELQTETERQSNRLSDMTQDTTKEQIALWMNLRKAAVSELNKITDHTSEAYRYVEDILRSANSALDGLYNSQLNAIDDIISLTEDMLKAQADDQIDLLDSEIDRYKTLIEMKKTLLAQSEDESDYERQVAKLVKEIVSLQESIGQLDLEIESNPDDSRKAQAERQKLLSSLKDSQDELADLQRSHYRESLSDRLDDEADAFEKSKQEEIDKIKDTVDDGKKLHERAIDYIDKNWDNLYNQLSKYAKDQGRDVEKELTKAWDVAKDAVDAYGGSILGAMDSIEKMQSMIQSTTKEGNYNQVGELASNPQLIAIVKAMKKNSTDYLTTSDASTRQSIKANQAALVKQFEQISGRKLAQGSDGTWYLDKVGGETVYSHFGVGDVVNPNRQNGSASTGNSYSKPSSKTILRSGSSGSNVGWVQTQLNKAAAKEGNSAFKVTVDSKFGAKTTAAVRAFQRAMGLSVDGQVGPNTLKYLEKYHTGGIVGGGATLKDNEVLAVLEKRETVLTNPMWQNLSERLMEIRDFVDSCMPQIQRISPLGTSAYGAPNGATIAPVINVQFEHHGDFDEKAARKFANQISDYTIQQIKKNQQTHRYRK